ncbi:MAG TPA: WYL domain-containing protein, partial [Thermoleophilaceae bacterium]|nr:WYL domain-containing protein [Thermoleophilaceae bacterium]
LAKIETAIFRRKTIVFDYYTMGRDAEETRRVDPYQLLFRGGRFYLIGRARERDDIRIFRLSRIRGKVAYATKSEHDFPPPKDFDPRTYASRADWQLGEPADTARVWVSSRIDWLVERHFGEVGTVVSAADAPDAPDDDGIVFETPYADARLLISWVLGLGERARILAPDELIEEFTERVRLVVERHSGALDVAPAVVARPPREGPVEGAAGCEPASDGAREAPIRPERLARLVTLAGILVQAAREARKLDVGELCETLQTSEGELREDIDVLNVVNFGGGSYVLYAEVQGDQIEVDPEPYGDSFARPARLLPLEAKALVAAIDLLGEHLPEGSLASARAKIVAALGDDPAAGGGLQMTSARGDDSEIARVVSQAVAARHLLRIDYYKENEDEFVERVVEPYQLLNGREGWYVHSFDPERGDARSFRLDRIRSAEALDERFEPRPGIEPDVEGWPRTGEVPASHAARVWVAPERARWAREERALAEELEDGAVVVELHYAGENWLVREILREAGDAAVLEPEEARRAVLEAAEAVAGLVRG